MSTLNQRIREFSADLPEKENINIDAFLAKPGNKRAMDDWIYKYDAPEKAKNAFKRKVSGIYKKIPKKQQRTITSDTNWERLLTDAKTQQTYLVNSSRVLRSSGTRVANELIKNMNLQGANSNTEDTTNGQIETDEEDQEPEVNNTIPEFNVGDIPEQHFRLTSGTDITPLWHCYKLISKEKACKEGLSLVSDLQKALSLSHIMLLVPQSNDKDMVNLFGTDTLSCIYREIHGVYIDNDIELDASLIKNLKKIIKNLRDGSITRIKAVVELANFMEDIGNEDAPIVQSIINCVIKLPLVNTNSKIGEMELITNYLDPILSPMFHQPDHGKLFKWVNLKNKESSKADLNLRPDGVMALNEQLNDAFALGFCEIKSMTAINRHNLTHADTFRLAMFAKNAIDDNNIKCTLAVQSVGTHVTFFLCALQSEGLYAFVKLEKITVPTSIDQLIDFIAYFDTCKQVIHTYNKFCIPVGHEVRSSLRKPSLTQLQINDMISEYQAGQSPSILYM